MNDERLMDIEIKIAFQEKTIKDLNQVVYEQQQEIERLRVICELVLKRTRAFSDFIPGSDGPADDKPPHY